MFADDKSAADRIREQTDAQVQALVLDAQRLRLRADQKRADAQVLRERGDIEGANRLENEADALDREARQLMQQRVEAEVRANSAIDGIARAEAEMDRERARAERDREMYDEPGFWDKVGDKAIDIIGSLLQNLLQQWLAGGGQDDNLLNQINDLQEERDRLLDERENGIEDGGAGRIITDPNGNYGYDRDGDGFVDIPLNPDGTPAGDFNPSNDNAYNNTTASALNDANDDELGSLQPGFLGNAGGGGASFGGGGGGPNFGGIGAPNAGNGLAGGEEEGGAFPGAEAGEDGDEDGDGIPDSEDPDSKKNSDGDEESDAETVKGRIVLLRKIEVAEVAGDHEEGGDWEDDFEEWGDDDWDDSADNGDKKKKDTGFGEEDFAGVGDAKDAAKLVDEVVRVETVIQQWRKVEASEDGEGDSKDEFGFEDEEMAGYRASGDDEEGEDDFADLMVDGKIDLTKVEIWVIEKDTWKEGKTPIRYKVEAATDLDDFNPKHGGWITARGKVEDLDIEDGVMSTIKGKVKKVELVAVVATLDEVPENMDQFDESQVDDEDVGGLDEDFDLGDEEDW